MEDQGKLKDPEGRPACYSVGGVFFPAWPLGYLAPNKHKKTCSNYETVDRWLGLLIG